MKYKTVVDTSEGKWFSLPCAMNCGGRCLNKVFVKNGEIIRCKIDDTHEDSWEWPQARACPMGWAQRQKVLRKQRELENLQKLATAKRSSRIAVKMEEQKEIEAVAEAERKHKADLANARKVQEKQRNMEEVSVERDPCVSGDAYQVSRLANHA